MLSVTIQALKKVGYVTLYTFRKFCLIYSDWAFEITLRSSSARLDQPCAVQIHLIGVRDTPDNCSVRYRELSLYDFTL